MLFIIIGILVVTTLLITYLLIISTGKQEQFLEDIGNPLQGSISEKIFVNINGIKQGMFIKSKNDENPVLLFLHGGPGMPEYAIGKNYPTVLEDNFTVCYWEQRGTGLSYHVDEKNGDEEISFEQLIADTLEVTDYLSKRFGQEKIYLMAHSGGTFIGIQAAAQAPEKYHAYIAIAQITKQLESEKLAYSYMLDQFQKMGDKKMQKKLKAIPLLDLETMPASYRGIRDEAMHQLGIGTTRKMKSVVKGIFLPVMLSGEYKFSEKINIWRGKWSKNSSNLWNRIIATDLTQEVTELAIPVYFFEGIYDYTCSYKLAKEYFEQLKAPKKEFYTFDQSAHSPLFEEPDKMQQILSEDILKEIE